MIYKFNHKKFSCCNKLGFMCMNEKKKEKIFHENYLFKLTFAFHLRSRKLKEISFMFSNLAVE